MFSEQSGQTSQTCHLNQLDRSRKVCQIINWIAPLRRSRLDDRNAYMECPIWSPDEKVMPSGRPAPRSDRSRGGQTGSKRRIRVRSCILTRDLLGFRFLMGTDLPTLYMKGHGRLRVVPIDSSTLPYFLSPNPSFSNPLLFFAHLYGIRGRSGWPVDSRTTLDLRAPTRSLPSSWF